MVKTFVSLLSGHASYDVIIVVNEYVQYMYLH
jgi:hypothetical protein